MCTGLEIAGLAAAVGGSALSAAGAARTQREQARNAAAAAKARNDQLRSTQYKNEKIAEEARDGFDQRLKKSDSASLDAEQAKAQGDRSADLTAAVDSAPAPTTTAASLSGSAPEMVRGEVAARLGKALEDSRGRAQTLGKLGGYSDMWATRGVEDANLARNLGVLANFQEGNLSGLGVRQDVAEMASQKPISPMGGMMQGLGGMIGSFAGAGMPGLGSIIGPSVSAGAKTAIKANPYGGLY